MHRRSFREGGEPSASGNILKIGRRDNGEINEPMTQTDKTTGHLSSVQAGAGAQFFFKDTEFAEIFFLLFVIIVVVGVLHFLNSMSSSLFFDAGVGE